MPNRGMNSLEKDFKVTSNSCSIQETINKNNSSCFQAQTFHALIAPLFSLTAQEQSKPICAFMGKVKIIDEKIKKRNSFHEYIPE